ncbi:methyltransferase domain-containing protein [candidate division WWE3 bacterium]|nr:methyltransferase domain-containing protein [candidate division WWE3 bacterium]
MKVVQGSKIKDLDAKGFKELCKNFSEKILDIGTGDGRFVFKNAQQNPHIFYVGLDPNQKQLEIYSKKINKFRLRNTLLILGSIEIFPIELENMFDKIYVHFPWGSLLGGIANAQIDLLKNLVLGLETNGILQIIFGYSSEAEPTQTDRLSLDSIDAKRIKEVIVPAFNKLGLELEKVEKIEKEELSEIETTWGKKLAFGQDRKMFSITLFKA